jgi:hypothetical protein
MTQQRPPKPRSQIARKPTWIADVENQKRWIAEFAAKLREVEKTDATISAILGSDWVVRECATQVRLYADLSITVHLYQDRQLRGRRHVAALKTAIKGIAAAAAFYADAGNRSAEAQLRSYEADLSTILQRSKQAYSSKRHGRDRDHTILVRLHGFLEKHVGHVTNATLATLVSKAMEIDGQAGSERFTEETVRKNLNAFRGKNSAMMTLLARESEGVRNQNDAK